MIKTTRVEVKEYLIKAYCACGGEMIFGGISKTLYPAIYGHICKACNAIEDLDRRYPYLSHEGIKESK